MSSILPRRAASGGGAFSSLSGVDINGATTGDVLTFDGTDWTYQVAIATTIADAGAGAVFGVASDASETSHTETGATDASVSWTQGVSSGDASGDWVVTGTTPNGAVASLELFAPGEGGSTATLTADEVYLVGAIVLSTSVATPTDNATPAAPEGTITWDGSYLYVMTASGWASSPLTLLPAP